MDKLTKLAKLLHTKDDKQFVRKVINILNAFNKRFDQFKTYSQAPGTKTTTQLIGTVEKLYLLGFETDTSGILRALSNFLDHANDWPQSTDVQREHERIIRILRLLPEQMIDAVCGKFGYTG